MKWAHSKFQIIVILSGLRNTHKQQNDTKNQKYVLVFLHSLKFLFFF
jgi:hypothetical protein